MTVHDALYGLPHSFTDSGDLVVPATECLLFLGIDPDMPFDQYTAERAIGRTVREMCDSADPLVIARWLRYGQRFEQGHEAHQSGDIYIGDWPGYIKEQS